jgi:hypothetical protein
MTKQRHYPTKFYLLLRNILESSEVLSDYCQENGENDLANFFWRRNGFDGLRSHMEAMIETHEPSFNGKTESRESRLRLAIERGQRRRKREAAKLNNKK